MLQVPTLKGKNKRRHLPLPPPVQVFTLSPKQPHACGNNHALSVFVLIWKCNSVFLTNIASHSGCVEISTFSSLKPSWCICSLWHSSCNDFGLIMLRKVKFYLRCYFSSIFLFFSPTPPYPLSCLDLRFVLVPCSFIRYITIWRKCLIVKLKATVCGLA